MKTIANKLTALQLICAVLVVAVLYALVNRQLSQRMTENFMKHGDVVAAALAKSVEPALISRDLPSAQSAIDETLNIPYVQFAYVTTPDGRIIAHTFVPTFPEPLRDQAGQVPDRMLITMVSGDEPVVIFQKPVLTGIAGRVYIGISEGHLNSTIREMELVILISIAGVMLITTLVFTIFVRQIVAPVRLLTAATEKLGRDGHESFQELPIISNDEIGVLTGAFNRMAGELRSQQESLETRVRMRTWELTEANDRLAAEVMERKRIEEDLWRAKEAADAANLAKSTFLATMSHEIRTPMNGILGMTELVLDSELTGEQRDSLDLVRVSAEALLIVINDVLDFSKIEAGKLDIECIPFDLRESLGETMKALGFRAHQKGLELIYEVHPDVPEAVLGDPGRIRQIVVNLVGNSIKFTATGEVLLSVTQEVDAAQETFLHFAVKDTGVGIPLDKQQKIFEPFSQADGSMARRYGGTGLGLTICTRLAEMMGGRIWVESKLAEGSTFHFTVRLIAQNPGATRPAPVHPEELRDLPALIVDDNFTNRRVLTGLLNRWGMRPAAVEGGRSALQALEIAKSTGRMFAMILLDRQMPEIDGFQLAEVIRKEASLSGVAIMLLTSAGRVGDAARCRELGIAGYLVKPVRQSELLDSILKVLQKTPEKKPESLVTRHTLRETRNRKNILLAEDNAVNQTLAVRLLEKRGYKVTVAGDGHAVLAAIEKDSFDLILMDIQMPGMDGFQATANIRDKEKTSGRHTPIIAMTAHSLKGDQERCMAAGMDGYVSKPIRTAELFAAIENQLAGKIAESAPPLPDPVIVRN